MAGTLPGAHAHVFLGEGHEKNERRTWMVIVLCSFMMVAEIAGGLLFGSIALVADGLHMSTHASALLLAALAYRYARRHVDDDRFSFGTGKLGDLAGFTNVSTPRTTAQASAAARMLTARPSARMAGFYQTGGWRSFQGRACSSWADREIRVPSPPIRPASITPIGRPSAVQCSGTFTAGWPDTL